MTRDRKWRGCRSYYLLNYTAATGVRKNQMVKNGGVSALTWQKINDFNCVIISDVRHVWHYILIRTLTKYINVVPIDVFFPHYIQ